MEWLNNMNSSLVIRNERSVHQSRYLNGGGILTAQLKNYFNDNTESRNATNNLTILSKRIIYLLQF